MSERLGVFELSLNGDDPLKLRCTPHALRFIEKKHGGLRLVIQKITFVEFQTMLDLIDAGLAGGMAYDKKVLEEEVFKHGLYNLIVPLTDYINLLGNGGQPPQDEKEAPKEGEA